MDQGAAAPIQKSGPLIPYAPNAMSNGRIVRTVREFRVIVKAIMH